MLIAMIFPSRTVLARLLASAVAVVFLPGIASAQTFNVNFSSSSGPNCIKNKIGVYQTPFMGTVGIVPPTAMQPLLAEANVKDLRYELGWGKGDCYQYNQIGGSSGNPTINFSALDPFITMLKTNGI